MLPWIPWLVDRHRIALMIGAALAVLVGLGAVFGVGARMFQARQGELALWVRDEAALLHAITDGSPVMGGLQALGLTVGELKEMAASPVTPGPGPADDLLEQTRRQFAIDEIFLVNREGRIVAYQSSSGHSGKGADVAYRPYVHNAMAGIANVYPAVGTTTGKGGFYLAAPVRAAKGVQSDVTGVVAAKVTMDQVSALFERNSHHTLLISPEGVVMASNRADWVYQLAGPVSPGRGEELAASRRYARTFDQRPLVSLPFDPAGTSAHFEGHQHRVISVQVDWHDPTGLWSLVVVASSDDWFPALYRLAVFVVAAVCCAFFLLWLHSLAARIVHSQRSAEQLGLAHQQTTAALADLQVVKNDLQNAFEVIEGSVRYASFVQRSILPDPQLVRSVFADHFILFEPREEVGGDIYWCSRWGDDVLFGLGDCTGRGVPGAFMTLIATGAFDRARAEVPPGDLGALLSRVHQLVQLTLKQNPDRGEADDGMEMGLCLIAAGGRGMTFAGARCSVFVLPPGGRPAVELAGDRRGIGYRDIAHDHRYDPVAVPLEPGARYYLTSDSMIGPPAGVDVRGAFGKPQFLEMLAATGCLPLSVQKDMIRHALILQRNKEGRRNDICVVGFTLPAAGPPASP